MRSPTRREGEEGRRGGGEGREEARRYRDSSAEQRHAKSTPRPPPRHVLGALPSPGEACAVDVSQPDRCAVLQGGREAGGRVTAMLKIVRWSALSLSGPHYFLFGGHAALRRLVLPDVVVITAVVR